MSFQWIYNHSPVGVQNVACTLRGARERRLRLGPPFNEYLDFLKKSEWYSRQDIEEYQNARLQAIISYAYNNVPYYHDVFERLHLTPSDIRSRDDLHKLPVLTKEELRNNFDRIFSKTVKKKDCILGHTSGSTGKALHFYLSKDSVKWRWAVWFRHRARFGINPGDPYATFTGLPAIPLNQRKPPYWRENYAMKQTIFTMHHINDRTIHAIVERLNKGGFKYYAGYPSIILTLANCILEAGLQITAPPKMVFTGAETLQENQRKIISAVLRAPVTDQYGFSEGGGNASRCEHDLFHEDFEYGILECDGEKTAGNEKTGKVIATGFVNNAMPLIRYEVGDTATWIETKCACGRHSRTIKQVEGRAEDFILTPEGNKILRFDYIFKETAYIKEAQVVQYKLDEIVIRMVRREGYSVQLEKYLAQQIKEKVSQGFKVNFEYVNEIEREGSGKFRAVKSYLSHS